MHWTPQSMSIPIIVPPIPTSMHVLAPLFCDISRNCCTESYLSFVIYPINMQRRRRRWGGRRRHGAVGRPPKPVMIGAVPSIERLEPTPKSSDDPLYLDSAEVEALRLIDLEKSSFDEAGKRMNVSRNTVWRLVEGARRKIVRAIIEGRTVIIQKAEET